MNQQMLADAPEHIQIEWERQREVNAVLDRAVQIASEAIAAALKGEKVSLPDKPSAGAAATDWHSYFIRRGAVRLVEEGGGTDGAVGTD